MQVSLPCVQKSLWFGAADRFDEDAPLFSSCGGGERHATTVWRPYRRFVLRDTERETVESSCRDIHQLDVVIIWRTNADRERTAVRRQRRIRSEASRSAKLPPLTAGQIEFFQDVLSELRACQIHQRTVRRDGIRNGSAPVAQTCARNDCARRSCRLQRTEIEGLYQ